MFGICPHDEGSVVPPPEKVFFCKLIEVMPASEPQDDGSGPDTVVCCISNCLKFESADHSDGNVPLSELEKMLINVMAVIEPHVGGREACWRDPRVIVESIGKLAPAQLGRGNANASEENVTERRFAMLVQSSALWKRGADVMPPPTTVSDVSAAQLDILRKDEASIESAVTRTVERPTMDTAEKSALLSVIE
jgi:hypothetical protein